MAATTYYVDANLATGNHDGSDLANAYASLSLAEAGKQKDLDTANEQMTIKCYSTNNSADTSNVWIFGWTTSASDYLTIQAASGEEALASGWSTSRYRLEVTDNDALLIQEENVRVIGLQIRIIYSASAYKSCVTVPNDVTGTGDVRIDSCRLRGDTASGAGSQGIGMSAASTTLSVYNTIVYNVTARLVMVTNGTANIYNCTMYNAGLYGMNQTGGTVTVKNTVVFATPDDFNGTFTIDYCASDDNDGTNNVAEDAGGGAAWTNTFEDAANGDFRLKSTSVLIGAATDNPGSGLFLDDIDGTTRSDWDVGAYEYTSGADVITWTAHTHKKMVFS